MRLEIKRQRTGDSQGRLPVARRAHGILAGGIDVAVLLHERGDAFAHPTFQHVAVCRFGQSHYVGQMGVPRTTLVAGILSCSSENSRTLSSSR